MRTLFLQAPSFDGFDGGAGSRYQARREIRSFWYPTWLAQVAAMVPDGKLIDAIPHRIGLADVVRQALDYDLAVLHTSTPSFSSDVRVVGALKAANPRLKVGFVGAKVAVEPQSSLQSSPAIDFVATEVFQSVDEFYRRFCFRAPKIASIMGEMVRSPQVMMRRLREGVEFFSFLRDRRELAH